MKRLLVVIALACVFSGTASAGEMPGVGKSAMGAVPIVGSTSTTAETTTAPGELPSANSTTSTEDADLVTAVLLTIFTLIGR